MTLHDYLLKNLESTVMITVVANDSVESFQYNYWNWFHTISQFHLIKDDGSIGHIIHTGTISVNNDGSILHTSKHHPKNCLMNFYFGGVKN